MSFDAALLSLSLLEQCGNLDGQSRQVAIEYAPDDFIPDDVILPRQESFASLHILTRRASEGSEVLPSLARRVRMSFFGARVITVNQDVAKGNDFT